MAISESEVKEYENLAELFNHVGWKTLQEKYVVRDIEVLEQMIWSIRDDKDIAQAQKHYHMLKWLNTLPELVQAEFERRMNEVEEDVDATL